MDLLLSVQDTVMCEMDEMDIKRVTLQKPFIEVCLSLPCLCGFSQGSLVSSSIQKQASLGQMQRDQKIYGWMPSQHVWIWACSEGLSVLLVCWVFAVCLLCLSPVSPPPPNLPIHTFPEQVDPHTTDSRQTGSKAGLFIGSYRN